MEIIKKAFVDEFQSFVPAFNEEDICAMCKFFGIPSSLRKLIISNNPLYYIVPLPHSVQVLAMKYIKRLETLVLSRDIVKINIRNSNIGNIIITGNTPTGMPSSLLS